MNEQLLLKAFEYCCQLNKKVLASYER